MSEPSIGPIPMLDSALLNIGSARLALEFAEDEHVRGDFKETLWRVNDAISQLQSAAAKIEKYLVNNGGEVRAEAAPPHYHCSQSESSKGSA